MKEGWMKNDECWRMNDEGWWFQAVEGFCDGQTNERTDICDCRVAFATEKCIKYSGSVFLLEISTEVDNDIVVDSKVGDSVLLVDIKVDNVTVVVVVPNINFSCRNC